MLLKASLIIFSSTAIIIGMSQTASAVPQRMADFTRTYTAAANSKLNTCTLCHTTVPALNPYGTDLRAAAYNFAAVEPKDSDNDGFTNIQEIRALTFPGNPADVPRTPAASAPRPGPAPVGLLQTDDFSDATALGDPNWEVISGFWFADISARALQSAGSGKSTAIFLGDPPLKGLENGTIEVNASLTVKSSKLSIVFDFMDIGHFRFVRLENSRVTVGQVGELAETRPGTKFVRKAKIPLNKFNKIKIGLLGNGGVSISATDSEGRDLIKPFSMKFAAASPGRIGLQAESKVLVDNFRVWEKIPGER